MRRQDEVIEACRLYAETMLESIGDYKNPESMRNAQTTLHDLRDYSNWILETISPLLNNSGELNEYKKLKALSQKYIDMVYGEGEYAKK